MADFQLLFEKDYELLQELTYSVKGEFKKTKDVILKAPTLRNAEKFERALEKGSIQIVKFICDNSLMIAQDNSPILSGDAESLHVMAIAKLAEDYLNFFFDLDSLKKKDLAKI